MVMVNLISWTNSPSCPEKPARCPMKEIESPRESAIRRGAAQTRPKKSRKSRLPLLSQPFVPNLGQEWATENRGI